MIGASRSTRPSGHDAYRGDLGLLYLITFDDLGALSRVEMVPTRMHRFRITVAGASDTRWLAQALAQAGEPLGTSVTIASDRLSLTW